MNNIIGGPPTVSSNHGFGSILGKREHENNDSAMAAFFESIEGPSKFPRKAVSKTLNDNYLLCKSQNVMPMTSIFQEVPSKNSLQPKDNISLKP